METLMIVGSAASILAVFVGFVFWRFHPSDVARLVSRAPVDRDGIVSLESAGLQIHDRALLNSHYHAATRREIYWPVVPAKSPNLIHITFLRYLIPLHLRGLRVTLFVFDEYASLVRGIELQVARSQAQFFVDQLLSAGLAGCSPKVICESDASHGMFGATRILPAMLRYLGTLRCADFEEFSADKAHIRGETKAIRYMKPVLNMLYFTMLKRRFGYVLSGADEQGMWRAFGDMAGSVSSPVNPVKLHIPEMRSVSGQETNALDGNTNVTMGDDPAVVSQKVAIALGSLGSNNAIGYFLTNVFFSCNKTLEVQCKTGAVNIASCEQLERLLRSGAVDLSSAVKSVAGAVESAFRGDIASWA